MVITSKGYANCYLGCKNQPGARIPRQGSKGVSPGQNRIPSMIHNHNKRPAADFKWCRYRTQHRQSSPEHDRFYLIIPSLPGGGPAGGLYT